MCLVSGVWYAHFLTPILEVSRPTCSFFQGNPHSRSPFCSSHLQMLLRISYGWLCIHLSSHINCSRYPWQYIQLVEDTIELYCYSVLTSWVSFCPCVPPCVWYVHFFRVTHLSSEGVSLRGSQNSANEACHFFLYLFHGTRCEHNPCYQSFTIFI